MNRVLTTAAVPVALAVTALVAPTAAQAQPTTQPATQAAAWCPTTHSGMASIPAGGYSSWLSCGTGAKEGHANVYPVARNRPDDTQIDIFDDRFPNGTTVGVRIYFHQGGKLVYSDYMVPGDKRSRGVTLTSEVHHWRFVAKRSVNGRLNTRIGLAVY